MRSNSMQALIYQEGLEEGTSLLPPLILSCSHWGCEEGVVNYRYKNTWEEAVIGWSHCQFDNAQQFDINDHPLGRHHFLLTSQTTNKNEHEYKISYSIIAYKIAHHYL